MGYTDAAEFLGLSPRTPGTVRAEGCIPYVPLPKRGRFLRHQLLQWLEGRSIKPARASREATRKKIKGVYFRNGIAYIRYLDQHGTIVRESTG
jgi:hypothetical protein